MSGHQFSITAHILVSFLCTFQFILLRHFECSLQYFGCLLTNILKMFFIFVDQNYKGKSKRIHYSGSIITPDGNMEDILREHDRNIQEAVRKARLDKN